MPGIRLTSHQSLIFTDIRPEGPRRARANPLRNHGVKLSEEIAGPPLVDGLRRPGPPAASPSPRPNEPSGMIDQLEVELAKLGLAKERVRPPHDRLLQPARRPCPNPNMASVVKAEAEYTIFLSRNPAAWGNHDLDLQGHRPRGGRHRHPHPRLRLLRRKTTRKAPAKPSATLPWLKAPPTSPESAKDQCGLVAACLYFEFLGRALLPVSLWERVGVRGNSTIPSPSPFGRGRVRASAFGSDSSVRFAP